MCISGALGGILGGAMEMGHVHGVLTGIQEGMQFFLNSVRTWMLPLMAICGVIALVLCDGDPCHRDDVSDLAGNIGDIL